MNAPGGNPHHDRETQVSISLTTSRTDRKHFKVDNNDALLDLMVEGASQLGIGLLPTPAEPLDRLYNVQKGEELVGPLDLELAVGEYVDGKETKRDFAIELVPAIAVNTRWRIATAEQMTPREILGLFGLDVSSYTLYLLDSEEPLPVDTPVQTVRGTRFEAQKDGKYGGTR